MYGKLLLKIVTWTTLILALTNCSEKTDKVSQELDAQEELLSTPLLTNPATTFSDLQDLLDTEGFRDISFFPLFLKAWSHDFLNCLPQDAISREARGILYEIIDANSYQDFLAIRSRIEIQDMIDPDSKAILAALIFRGIKQNSNQPNTYTEDTEKAFELLHSIEDETLISLIVKTSGYYGEYGPFDLGPSGLSDVMDENRRAALLLEDSLSDPTNYASTVIQDYINELNSSESEETIILNLMRGERACFESAYFTINAIELHLEAYLELVDIEEVKSRVQYLLEKGVPTYPQQYKLLFQELAYNDDLTDLAEPEDKSQQELVLAAQAIYKNGIEHHVQMGMVGTWCTIDNDFQCKPRAPYPAEYVRLLEEQFLYTQSAEASLELSSHYKSIGDLKTAIRYKFYQMQVSKNLDPTGTAFILRELGELIFSEYREKSLNYISYLIDDYKINYLPKFLTAGANRFWEIDNLTTINDYEIFINNLKIALNSANDEDSGPSRFSSVDDLNLGNYHALLIANADYLYLNDLKTPVKDVEVIDDILRSNFGFNTTVLVNAGRTEIMDAINQLREKLTKEDNLLIYYAGHGYIDPANEEAYWQPADSAINSNTNWISTNTVISSVRALEANNVMVLADSCFSGALMREVQFSTSTDSERNVDLEIIQALSDGKSRVAISSGALEPVVDYIPGNEHSIFAQALIKFLESSGRDAFPARDLYLGLSSIMSTLTAGSGISQTPLYSSLVRAGHEAGDFVFRRGM